MSGHGGGRESDRSRAPTASRHEVVAMVRTSYVGGLLLVGLLAGLATTTAASPGEQLFMTATPVPEATSTAGPNTVLCESNELGAQAYELAVSFNTPNVTEKAHTAGAPGVPCTTMFIHEVEEEFSISGDVEVQAYLGCEFPSAWHDWLRESGVLVQLRKNGEAIASNHTAKDTLAMCEPGDVIEAEVDGTDIETTYQEGDELRLDVHLMMLNTQPAVENVYFLVDSEAPPSGVTFPLQINGTSEKQASNASLEPGANGSEGRNGNDPAPADGPSAGANGGGSEEGKLLPAPGAVAVAVVAGILALGSRRRG